jgi:beta-lactamase class A
VTAPPGTAVVAGYRRERERAGGDWRAYVSAAEPMGRSGSVALLDDGADRVVHGYSVQKLAVAVAVLDTVDRGLLRLDHRLELTAGDVLGGGAYHLQPVVGDLLTVANVVTAMLLVSDNTAVRLCGRVVPGPEINGILAGKGFGRTRVEPVGRGDRFLLGVTTAREIHDLLWRLATRTLLAPASCDFLLRVMRAPGGYVDGVRRDMSSAQRARVATKAGADFDERGAARHEVGVVFDAAGSPALTYAFLADALGERENYGGTHPAVRAHAALGPVLLTAADTLADAGASGPRANA